MYRVRLESDFVTPSELRVGYVIASYISLSDSLYIYRPAHLVVFQSAISLKKTVPSVDMSFHTYKLPCV